MIRLRFSYRRVSAYSFDITNQSMDQLMDTFLSAYSTDQKEIVNMLSSTLFRAFQGEFTLVTGLLPAV